MLTARYHIRGHIYGVKLTGVLMWLIQVRFGLA